MLAKDPKHPRADNKDSDQSDQRDLSLAGSTCNLVGNAKPQLICSIYEYHNAKEEDYP